MTTLTQPTTSTTTTSETTAKQVDLPAPLVIGITGHRDLRDEDRPQLQAAVRQILLDLRSRYRFTPLLVLSALSEGADRLAAEVALMPEIGAELVAPLPMPRSIYEDDFDAVSRAEFRNLLSKAHGVLELPLARNNTVQGISTKGNQRDRQYQSVGEYIVRKSQILIALWDGVDTGLVGGTAAVVRFQIDGLPQIESNSLEALEGFPVYHVLTPRQRNPQPKGDIFTCQILYPRSFEGDDAKARRYYDRMFSRIDRFNGYATYPPTELRDSISKSKRYLLRDLEESHLPPRLHTELNHYGLTDALAIAFRREKIRIDRRLHTMMFLAVALFASFAHVWHNPLPLALALALIFLAALQRHSFRAHDGDTNSEDYRAMAEGLRVRFFWRMVGLSDSVADYYFGKQRSELDWIRNGFRGWDVHFDVEGGGPPRTRDEYINTVRIHWVNDQMQYFEDAVLRDEKRLARIEVIGKLLACIGITLGSVLLGGVLFQSRAEWLAGQYFYGYDEPWEAIPIVVIEASLAAAALLHNYGNRMAYREHIKQYSRMQGVFSRALQILTARTDIEQAIDCIRKVGREALAENGDWVLLHRERPLDVPHP